MYLVKNKKGLKDYKNLLKASTGVLILEDLIDDGSSSGIISSLDCASNKFKTSNHGFTSGTIVDIADNLDPNIKNDIVLGARVIVPVNVTEPMPFGKDINIIKVQEADICAIISDNDIVKV